MFGIDIIAKGDWTELSVGDASVVVPSDDGDCFDKEKFILWHSLSTKRNLTSKSTASVARVGIGIHRSRGEVG